MEEQEIKVITKCKIEEMGKIISAISMVKGVVKVSYTTDNEL